MTNKNYKLRPVLGTIKEGFTLVDENDNLVYEGKMIKFSLFGSSLYNFTNYITNKTEEHKLGKTVTAEETGIGGMLSTSSYFKYDGVKIWDFLHDKGIRISSNMSQEKIGMSYDVSFEGKLIATITTSTPKGKSFITTDMYYDVICCEKDLDLVFLIALSIAKTNQVFYN